jgi:hypothetical protein
MQTSPTSSSVLLMVVSLVFTVPVAIPMAFAAREANVLVVGFLSIFVVVGCWLGAMGYRSFRTRHRFTLGEDELLIEWVRGGKVDKIERIPRAELIDVAIDDAPSSGTPVFGLVLGTRNGEIDLSEGRTSWGLAFYQARCEQLASFLGIPVRP